MARRILFAFVSLAMAAAFADARPIMFARYPHVAHGKIAFSYHGDIWVANVDGSGPTRLTAHVARDTFPRFSPDGKWIAFTSNRMGNDDVFVIPATGGDPRQLTFFTGNDTVLYWTPDGQRIVFATQRGSDGWGSPLHTISKDGGTAEPLPMDRAAQGMIKQDGSAIVFNRQGFSYWRKGYRGNRSDDVWVQDLKTKAISRVTDTDRKAVKSHVQDIWPMWGADGLIYFASERDGHFNIWRVPATGGNAVQVTTHTKDGVQFASISPDGKTVAYENEFELWTLEVPGWSPRKMTIDLEFDPKENLVEYLPSKNKADAFDPAPDGEALAIEFHGEIVLVPSDPDIGEKRQVTLSAWRDRRPVFSPDGRYVTYISDETKEQEFWLFDRQTGARRTLTTHASFKDDALWAPDSKRLALTAANRLFLADVEANTVTEVAYNQAGGYQLGDFSPGGKWIIYGRRDDQLNADLYAFDIAARKESNLTANPFGDTRGILTPDGTHLVFLSDRADGVVHLFAVPLARHEVPLLRREDARCGLGGHEGALRAAAGLRRREPGPVRSHQRADW